MAVEYPDNWIVKKCEECISFYAEDGVDALQISAYSKDGIVTLEDLKEFAENEVPKDANVASVFIGNYFGLQSKFEYKKTFWQVLFLAKDKVFLYITYNCDFELKETEKDVILQIINSLK